MTETRRSILITGANGFVGSALCRRFFADNYRVIAGVRQTSDLSNLKNLDLEFRYGDVTVPDSLPEMVRGVDYVIHNAGIVKARSRQMFFDVNEKGTRALFDALLKHNPIVKKVIYISSLAAAGCSINGEPVRESDQPHPMSSYGKSKLAGERTAMSFADRLHVLSIRPPGIYGPGDKEIMAFFKTLNSRIKPYFGNVNRRLQLVHIDDLTRGVSKALSANTQSGEIYFICEKRSYRMKEIIDIMEMGSGKKAYRLLIPAPLFRLIGAVSEFAFRLVGATPMLTREKARELLASWEASTDKAERDLGFVSDIALEQGVNETYRWYRREGWLK